MNISEEIDYYIKSSEAVGALLISGPWGSGKTHVIKSYIDNNKEIYAFGLVSLFGVESVEQFNKRVKDAYLSKLVSVSKTIEKGKKIVDCLSNVVADSPLSSKSVSTVAKGVSNIVAFDYMSLFDVKNTIKIKTKSGVDEIPFVLVIDDFERCSLPIKDKLGVINGYLEVNGIKTIILADEEKIILLQLYSFMSLIRLIVPAILFS